MDEALAVADDHSGIRLGLEVEPPRRFRVCPTVHGHRDEVCAVFEVAEDHLALLAGAPPGGRQVKCAPPLGFRAPQSDSATGDSVRAPVDAPGEADEPARRNTRWSPSCVRHGCSLVVRDCSPDCLVAAYRRAAVGRHGRCPCGSKGNARCDPQQSSNCQALVMGCARGPEPLPPRVCSARLPS